MERCELDNKISDVAKTLLSYCAVRTSNQFEAEDLAQDIILEIYKSVDNLRDQGAFYGFMWAVAGNVYKKWCKSKANNKRIKLSEDIGYNDFLTEKEDSEKFLLRRELALLSEKYRKVVILYYIENMSCLEISDKLSISESMVKYLLFKSRKIIKEGMSMERNYGSQSYNPRELTIAYWGDGINRYTSLGDSKISQNILFACYNDRLSAEEISLQIGVALPYMEDKLNELVEYELLKKDGNRYYTNLVIFTEDFSNEVSAKTGALRGRIADILQKSIAEKEKEARDIAFMGADMNIQTFRWQMTSFILRYAIMEMLQNKIKIAYPKDNFGTECLVFGVEKKKENTYLSQFEFGSANIENTVGDSVKFMDIPVNGEMTHKYFFNSPNITNVFLDIAKGNTKDFSENDKAIVADMVRKGYVLARGERFFVNAPVFTIKQYQRLKEIFATVAEQIALEAEALIQTIARILKNHMPIHLKKFASDMAYLRLFEDAISAPISILCKSNYLFPYNGGDMLPTTRVVLK